MDFFRNLFWYSFRKFFQRFHSKNQIQKNYKRFLWNTSSHSMLQKFIRWYIQKYLHRYLLWIPSKIALWISSWYYSRNSSMRSFNDSIKNSFRESPRNFCREIFRHALKNYFGNLKIRLGSFPWILLGCPLINPFEESGSFSGDSSIIYRG